MEIKESPHFRAAILDKIAQREFAERTGVHCTDLLYCLNKQAWRRLDPRESTDRETLLFSLGWATQRWLTGKPKDEDSLLVDNIVVTPDALTVDGCPWELKCTFQSSERPIEESIHWVRQLMCQCYALKKLKAELTRFELMGNWKSVFGKKEDKGKTENEKPTFHAYEFVFTQEELDRNWAWIKTRRDLYLQILSTAVPLPKIQALAPDMSFECGYCDYKERCG